MVVLSDPEPRSRMNSNNGVSQVDPALFPLVLLVEDNEDSIETFVVYLEVKGYRMLVARNGQEGISLLKAKHPGLILMDIQMPEMDGLEAMSHIRCLLDCANIPIIALTSLAMEGDQNRCLLAGADSYLSKPVQFKQLIATIQQFLELDFRGRSSSESAFNSLYRLLFKFSKARPGTLRSVEFTLLTPVLAILFTKSAQNPI